jgi:holo-[acyl-carrier protein] synthase
MEIAMAIVGHGIDIIQLCDIQRRLNSREADWLEGTFSKAEMDLAGPAPHRTDYFGGHYAAKEAVAKALGTGFSDDVAWLDIEILKLPTGAPIVRLSGGAKNAADALGVDNWVVSIGHSGDYAIASAIASSG